MYTIRAIWLPPIPTKPKANHSHKYIYIYIYISKDNTYSK